MLAALKTTTPKNEIILNSQKGKIGYKRAFKGNSRKSPQGIQHECLESLILPLWEYKCFLTSSRDKEIRIFLRHVRNRFWRKVSYQMTYSFLLDPSPIIVLAWLDQSLDQCFCGRSSLLYDAAMRLQCCCYLVAILLLCCCYVIDCCKNKPS